jgi:serine protease Do
MEKQQRKLFLSLLALSIILSSVFGAAAGFVGGAVSAGGDARETIKKMLQGKIAQRVDDEAVGEGKKVALVSEKSDVVSVVEKVSPAVASIIVTKDIPKIERFRSSPFGSDFFREFFGGEDPFGGMFDAPQYRQNGTEKREVGGGTGFIISADGYVVTNKHVVADMEAEYTVLTNDEKKYPAKVLARDPLNDLAVLKIEAKNLATLELGDSSKLKPGQTVVAIGNALGEFRNTVSTGVISGLSRSITAGGAGFSENLTGVIQTDASINPGNSGGPLLNIAGQVIGINTAIAQGAQNIGFAIPINEVKNTIDSVKKTGKISRPWLGLRYQLINQELAEVNKLPVDYGALVVRGEKPTDLAVIPGSPADKAGIAENDIVLEIDGVKVGEDNPLANLVGKHKVGEEIRVKILHKGEEKEVKVKLEEMK